MEIKKETMKEIRGTLQSMLDDIEHYGCMDNVEDDYYDYFNVKSLIDKIDEMIKNDKA